MTQLLKVGPATQLKDSSLVEEQLIIKPCQPKFISLVGSQSTRKYSLHYFTIQNIFRNSVYVETEGQIIQKLLVLNF